MPWLARTIVAPIEGCTIAVSLPGAEGFNVGAAPQWSDDSLDTYAYFKGRWGTGVANDGASATASIGSAPEGVVASANARVAVWHKSLSPNQAPFIRIFRTSGAGIAILEGSDLSSELTAPEGWSADEVIPTFPVENPIEDLLAEWINGVPWLVQFATRLTGPEPEGVAFEEHTVYEARVVVYHEVRGPAPACRQFPGGIQGTVGGAVRQFPPPKYRQTSGRGAGGTY